MKKIILSDAIKTYTHDQDKILQPEETVKRFKKRITDLNLDILESTVRIDNGRLGIPVYFSYCGKDAMAMTGTKKQMGKGGTSAQAEASAVMELAERFSFFSFYRNAANFITEKYGNLKGRAMPFELIAKSVHDESEDLDAAQKIFENLSLQWTGAYSLTDGREVLVPFNWFYTINEFNGPSAGNCVEEALIQGICEIVERHVSSLISRNRLAVPAIDPDSADQPLVVEMLGKYKNTGVQLYISDFSLDTGIPTIGILAYDPSTFPAKSEIVWTAGTTPDPQKSLSRALTEVAQLAGDFNTGSNYVASGLPKFKAVEDADFITNPGKTVGISSLPNLSDENLKTEIQNCIRALNENGMEVIVVDTMHSGLQIPAFYTIIPGAHFRERALGTSVGMFSAKIVAEKGDPETALAELRGMEDLLGEKYYLKFYTGLCRLETGRPDLALPELEKALERDPNTQDIPSIYSYMGYCLKDLGQYKAALAALEAGEKYDAERTDILNLMGFCHFKLKSHEKAIEYFKRIIKLNPSSAIDYANIASNYRDMGNTENAIRYYQMALSIDPGIDFARDALEKLLG